MKSKKSGIYLTIFTIIMTIYVALKIQAYYLAQFCFPLWGEILIEVVTVSLIFFILIKPIVKSIFELDKNLKEIIDHTLHELNTPIATIQANLSLLTKVIKDEKSLKRFERIQKATKNLKQLYQSLEYEIKQNINYKEKTDFELTHTIQNSIEKFDESKNNITITNLIDKKLTIYANQDGFEKMVDNIISNAIKYNKPNGFLKIYLKNSELFFEDSGIGIEPKNLFHIYEKSFQEDKKSDGFGLGLHFVKNYCDESNIKFKIDTKKDIGTTFRFELAKCQPSVE